MKAVTEALKRQLRIEEAAIYANQIERYSRTSFAGYECLPLHPERPEYIEELKAAIAVLESTPADDWVKEVRAAFAAYHQTEGCSCCQDIEGHKEAENKLIELLKPAMYSDNSGADWGQYITT